VLDRSDGRSSTWVARSRPRDLTNAEKSRWNGLTIYRSILCQLNNVVGLHT